LYDVLESQVRQPAVPHGTRVLWGDTLLREFDQLVDAWMPPTRLCHAAEKARRNTRVLQIDNQLHWQIAIACRDERSQKTAGRRRWRRRGCGRRRWNGLRRPTGLS